MKFQGTKISQILSDDLSWKSDVVILPAQRRNQNLVEHSFLIALFRVGLFILR